MLRMRTVPDEKPDALPPIGYRDRRPPAVRDQTRVDHRGRRPTTCANRIAVRFAYEWHDDGGNWFRSYGNENWEFDVHGLMGLRIASINDLSIKESERKYHWPLCRRPDDYPSLSDLGL
jgi:hypothetical protein